MSRTMGTNIITGSSGFIGTKLAKQLGAYLIDKVTEDDLEDCYLPPANTIYHLAALTSVQESWKFPIDYSKDFTNLVRLVKIYPNAKIIYAQSASSINPASPYGFSKWICGEYLKRFHKDYVICIFPNVWGGGKGVVDSFKDKNEVTIYGDGLQVRDFVHVDDIVEGLLLAKDWKCGEYSMGSGIGTRIIDLAKGKKINFAPALKETRESILSNTTPNWSPKIKI